MKHKRAYIWTFGGRVLPQLIYLLTNIFLAHYLTPTDFGQIGVLAIFISISSTLTDAGFGGSLIKEDYVSSLDLSTVFIYNLIVSILLYLVLFFCAPFIESYFSIDGLKNIVRTLSLVFVINAWALIPKTLLIRDLHFKSIAIIAVIAVILASIISIIGALQQWGAYSLVAYQLTYAIVEVVSYEIVTRYKHSFRFSLYCFKKLFSFGFYTTLCNVLESAYTNIMTMLFGKFMTISVAGYFYQAQKLETSATNSLASTINTTSFPILTKIKNDRKAFISESNSLLKSFSLFLFPLFWLIVIYSREIITFIYGPEWQEASIYLSLLIIVGVFYVLESLTRNFIKSLGQVKILAKYSLFKRIIGLIFILGFLIVGPFYMLYGYILSTIFGYIVNNYILSKILHIKFLFIIKENSGPLCFTLPFPFIFLLIHQINNLFIEVPIDLGIFLIYYIIIIPRIFGIKIIKLIHKKA